MACGAKNELPVLPPPSCFSSPNRFVPILSQLPLPRGRTNGRRDQGYRFSLLLQAPIAISGAYESYFQAARMTKCFSARCQWGMQWPRLHVRVVKSYHISLSNADIGYRVTCANISILVVGIH